MNDIKDYLNFNDSVCCEERQKRATVKKKKIVNRNNPILKDISLTSPLTVGNGNFAYTVDVTGLQTLYSEYQKDTPLCTMSNWGWHTIPAQTDSGIYTDDDLIMDEYYHDGRIVRYPRTKFKNNEKVYDWLRQNPHKVNLARVGLYYNGNCIETQNISDIEQQLDIYSGVLYSKYKINNELCKVITVCDPYSDSIGISLESELLCQGLTIDIEFPYGDKDISGSDWNNREAHTTEYNSNIFTRIENDLKYYVSVNAQNCEIFYVDTHHYRIKSNNSKIKIVLSFLHDSVELKNKITFETLKNNSCEFWKNYWEKSLFLDIYDLPEEKSKELERRIILSQYLLVVNCCGDMPPQETGLTCNSWYGKAHLEMHFWHMAWAPLWNHPELLKRSISWYHKIINSARANAARNGNIGARWPKMVGNTGIDSPSKIAPLLVWQQPHIIYMLELIRESDEKIYDEKIYDEKIYDEKTYDEKTYDKKTYDNNNINYNKIYEMDNPIVSFMMDNWILVKETADFMADFVVRDKKGIYHIEAPVIPVQERHLPEDTRDPAFEVTYWKFALKIAIRWAEILDMEEKIYVKWKDVSDNMALPPIYNNVYIAQANCPETFSKVAIDHPSMLQCLGMLPGKDIDKEIMKNTLKEVIDKWNYNTLWGWDFAVIAMTADSLGLDDLAVDQLLCDTIKNCYVESGNNRQISRDDLPLYLPGNGSLLLAAARIFEPIKLSEEEQKNV